MSLQLILGKSGAGKSRFLAETMIRESIEHPEYNYIVLVPEQATMQTKKQLIALHPNKVLLNIDVLNFPRFAHRILGENGGEAAPILDDVGKSLILRKIAQEKKEYLKVIGGNIHKNGYIREVKSILSEMEQYRVSPEMLFSQAEQIEKKPALQYKLEDLALLYQAFQEFLEGRYIVSEELLEVSSQKVGQSEIVKNSIFVLDGYTGFTPVQFLMLEALLRYGKKVMLTVTIEPEEYPVSFIREQELFALSKKTIRKLLKLAENTGTKVLAPILLESDILPRFKKKGALSFLEQNLFRFKGQAFEEEPEGLSLCQLTNPYEEIVFVGRVMEQLVRTHGYHYKDFAVVSGNMDIYAPFLEQVFEECHIPYFKDNKRCILENPMMECVCSALEIVLEDFSYESVFRYLKSGMSDLSTESIDRLENYVIAAGIRGRKKWGKEFVRTVRGMDEQALMELNECRTAFMEEVDELAEGLKGKGTVEEKTRCLYEYLKRRNMQQKLAGYEALFSERQELTLAREYGQIYKLLMDLLDTYVNLLGDVEVTLREYRDILQSGFEQTMVGNIPSSADQVMVGDIERSRMQEVQVLFLVGANDGLIPKAADKSSLLSELEREALKGRLELAPGAREKFYTQKFYLYLNLTKPRERLYVTFSNLDAAGKSLRPSYLIATLIRLFPKLAVKRENPWEASYISKESHVREYLLKGLEKRERPALWKELFTWYLEREGASSMQGLLKLHFITEKESAISQAAAKALYGDFLEGSVTRLEQYAACAYAQFLQYGLRLKEREEFSFASTDMGTVFHNTLDLFAKRLKQDGLSWVELSEAEANEILEECFQTVLAEYAQSNLYATARNEYMEARMRRILRRTLWSIRKQLEVGRFTPERFEISFEKRKKLSESGQMLLRGRIDRLDTYEEGDRLYLKVLDYKSGSIKFDLTGVYLGLQLQLPLYLIVAEEFMKKQYPDKEVVPAGILYYKIDDPLVETDGKEGEAVIEDKIFEQFRMSGIVQQEPEILAMFDGSGASKSRIIPVGYKKDGTLTASSNAYSQEEFSIISNYVNQKVEAFGREILNGNIEAKPYEFSGHTACTYCAFQNICPFDGHKSPFQKADKMEKNEIIEKMKEESHGRNVDEGAGTGNPS